MLQRVQLQLMLHASSEKHMRVFLSNHSITDTDEVSKGGLWVNGFLPLSSIANGRVYTKKGVNAAMPIFHCARTHDKRDQRCWWRLTLTPVISCSIRIRTAESDHQQFSRLKALHRSCHIVTGTILFCWFNFRVYIFKKKRRARP